MLAAFLTKDQNKETKDIFAGFSIATNPKFENIRREHQQKYAVNRFSFSHCRSALTVVQFRNKFSTKMRDRLLAYYREYEELLDPKTKLLISSTVMQRKDFAEVLEGFYHLIITLRNDGNKIAVLIDEYDAPFHLAIEKAISETAEGKPFVLGEFYSRIVILMRKFYSFFFKDGLSPLPECGVIIGITYMAKTSILSDLTDFKAYTTLGYDQFGPYFGFLEKEVKWLIETSQKKLAKPSILSLVPRKTL
ncbi:unnamed protein product [Bemisia tabaci]|uniref:AAA-ATPase-like domain-containing protein n=1 Tax=Bemisia tabaci TaxID=7038 RepID=A0AAI8UUG9_BEMTA|nr:unnamed protein product [Bemisia tabaci]